MVAPTIVYFGQYPSTVVLQSSDNMNGTAMTGTPVITPGVITFPVQSQGGLFKFHTEGVNVIGIDYQGGGTLTVKKMLSSGALITIATQTGDGHVNLPGQMTSLMPGEALQFFTAGATTPTVAVTSQITNWELVI